MHAPLEKSVGRLPESRSLRACAGTRCRFALSLILTFAASTGTSLAQPDPLNPPVRTAPPLMRPEAILRIDPTSERAAAAMRDAELSIRFTKYLRVWLHWADRIATMTPDQRREIETRLDAAVAGQVQDYHAVYLAGHRPGLLDDTFPLLFLATDPRPNVRRQLTQHQELADKLLAGIATDDQLRLLSEQAAARDLALRRSYAENLVNVLCEELVLTPSLRETLTDRLLESASRPEDVYYARDPVAAYFPYRAISPVQADELKQALTPAQRTFLEHAVARRTSRGAPVQFSVSSPDELLAQLEPLAAAYREQIASFGEMHVAALEENERIAPEKLARFRLAIKGIARDLSAGWLDLQVRIMQTNGMDFLRPNGALARPLNLSVSPPAFQGAEVLLHPLWHKASEEVRAEVFPETWRRMRQTVRGHTLNTILALLDSELWLTADQRHQLAPLVEESLPEFEDELIRRSPLRDIIRLAYPLARIPQPRMKEILSPEQFEVWLFLWSHCGAVGEAGSIIIRLRNGETYAFTLR